MLEQFSRSDDPLQPQLNTSCKSSSSLNLHKSFECEETSSSNSIIPTPVVREPRQKESSDHTSAKAIEHEGVSVGTVIKEEVRDKQRRKHSSWYYADDASDGDCSHRIHRGSHVAVAAAKRIINMTSQTGVRRRNRNNRLTGTGIDNSHPTRRRRKRSSVPRLARLFQDEDEVSISACLCVVLSI